jgi:hypothetical protein
MTRDDIIKLARKCNFAYYFESGDLVEMPQLERFAALVAAHEREACAKVVEPDDEHRRDASLGYLGGVEGVELLDICAAAIRARGNP